MQNHFHKIRYERQGTVAIIRLYEPETLNAVTFQMLDELDAALSIAEADARALILTGEGGAFCSGAGLKEIDGGDGLSPDFGRSLESHFNPLMTRLRNLSIPFITAVPGVAAGSGCALALSGDIIVAARNASFIQAFSKIGLVPDAASTYLLGRGISRVRAMEMALLGSKIPADKALEWGLINQVVDGAELADCALSLATRLGEGPTSALRSIRKLIWGALDLNWEMALRAEREAQRAAGQTVDFQEGLSAFKEKRPPKFVGR